LMNQPFVSTVGSYFRVSLGLLKYIGLLDWEWYRFGRNHSP